MYNKYQDIRKVLFIRFGSITDVVHTTATYQVLRQNFKNLIVDYLTSSLMQELVNNDLMLRQVISLDDPTFDGVFRLAQKLSDEHYDLIVNFQPGLKTYLFDMVINKRFTVTYKETKLPRGEKQIHAVNDFFKTIHPILPEVEIPQDLKIYINPEVEKWAKHQFEVQKLTHTLGIIPGVGNYQTSRLWPKERWKVFLDYVANKKGLNIAIFGGTNEQKLATELQTINKDKIRNFCGKLSIGQTAALLSLCMVVIGVDTGPTHIATAVGPKVIGLYGPTDINRKGLYGRGHEMLTGQTDCQFCNKKECSITKEATGYAPCMAAISVDMILKTIGI